MGGPQGQHGAALCVLCECAAIPAGPTSPSPTTSIHAVSHGNFESAVVGVPVRQSAFPCFPLGSAAPQPAPAPLPAVTTSYYTSTLPHSTASGPTTQGGHQHAQAAGEPPPTLLLLSLALSPCAGVIVTRCWCLILIPGRQPPEAQNFLPRLARAQAGTQQPNTAPSAAAARGRGPSALLNRFWQAGTSPSKAAARQSGRTHSLLRGERRGEEEETARQQGSKARQKRSAARALPSAVASQPGPL